MIKSKDDLICILNELYKTSDSITIKYPPIGRLFTIEFGDKCIVKPISEHSYKDERKRFLFKNKSQLLDNEVPKSSDFRQCVFASGILKSDGQEELEEKIKEGGQRNLLNGNRPLFVGYDTNALRWRLNKVVESTISDLSSTNISQIGLCISGNVSDELSYQWSPKYKGRQIPIPNLLFSRDFLNQQPKDARMARLGAIEQKQIFGLPQFKKVEYFRHGKEPDDRIIESYDKFSKDYNVDVLLISGDKDFVYKAQAKRMNAHLVKYPSAIDNSTKFYSEWDNVANLIFCTAIIFGYIEMENINIYGIWIGKEGKDWDSYNLKMEINTPDLEDRVERDLGIIEGSVSR